MQYDKDIKGVHADIFKSVRKILLSYAQIKELKNENQTSYSDEYGVIVMMRSRKDMFVMAFGKGAQLQERYPMLQGSGKIVRHLYFRGMGDLDEKLLREMIEESFVLGMEKYEMQTLKNFLRDQ
ncbi:MAG: hypothetical protein B5M46_02545 [Epsilonproteobacteria bacterium 4484_20]|nr:MAG: hypothetical protein B5M46_02545 [Epsilonproteobacteria bacterium 4484_20]